MTGSKFISVVIFGLGIFYPVRVGAVDTVNFVHTDQLGSVSLVTDQTGEVVAQQSYYPYGNTRSYQLSVDSYQLGERQYTGQISDQNQTGLYYYNARYYNPTLAKFTQADTVNGSMNKYAYTGNNPINRVDPSGNISQILPDQEGPVSWDFPDSPDNESEVWANFVTDPEKPGVWTNTEIEAVNQELQKIGEKLMREMNSQIRREMNDCRRFGEDCGDFKLVSEYEAFIRIFGGPVNFVRSSKANGWAGEFKNANDIYIYDVITADKRNTQYIANNSKLIVHEIGHLFNYRMGLLSHGDINPVSLMTGLLKRPDRGDKREGYYGFAGGFQTWQFGAENDSSEVFADMFIGWVYDRWEDSGIGKLRKLFMDSNMSNWLSGSLDSMPAAKFYVPNKRLMDSYL